MRAGYEVVVAARVRDHAQRIREAGFRLIPLELMRESYSPLRELRAIRQLRRIYRTEKPDIVHHVALKPVLYGSIAALGTKDIKVVNALVGLGYLVSSASFKARVLRFSIWRSLRFLLNRPYSRVLLQNDDDRQLLVDQVSVPPEKTIVIRGSGVDTKTFQPTAEPSGDPVVLLAARMLWIKGIGDFVEAASLLKARNVGARFVLAGDTDVCSPSGISPLQLQEWQGSGIVEWWGHQDEMHSVLQRVNIVCLPSHGGEGVAWLSRHRAPRRERNRGTATQSRCPC